MMRKNRSPKHTILIICEGEKTEPLYFKEIRDELIERKSGEIIKIHPEPKIEAAEEEKEKNPHKTKRKQRELKKRDNEDVIYGTPPLKYVQFGKEKLLDGSYDEVWVVFDHDNHPARKEAFEEAEIFVNGKKVQIAFSSRSFEHWLLCHFEKNYTTFTETDCKDSGKKSQNCNRTKGCFGDKCLSGKLRVFPELENYSRKLPCFKILKPYLETAFENAAWLRWKSEISQGSLPVYERNPYTNADKLVGRLLDNPTQIEWIGLNQWVEHDNLEFKIEFSDTIRLTVINNDERSLLIKEGEFYAVLSDSSKLNNERLIISQGSSGEIELDSLSKAVLKIVFIYHNYCFYVGLERSIESLQ